ncbi:MAG TPA: DUF4270 family protein [Bacteroidales bacterium]|nr:DUF4270 family protein [Bacteroidales bacterium]HPS71897.1 DUF4270 family protein [Bacteroidales bacterium]
MRKLSLLVLTFVALVFVSCDDELTSLGLNLRNPNDLLGTSFMDSTTLTAQSILDDTIASTGLGSNVIGYVNDPTFGITKASVYSQYLLSGNSVDFGTAPVLDSVILTIRVGGFFGDTTTALPIRVYELDQKLYSDSTYRVSSTVAHKSENLTYDPNYSVRPSPTTRVLIDTNSYDAHLRIRLTDDFGLHFLQNSSSMVNDATFANFFKGLYITVENPQGTGSLLYVNLTSSISGISIHYKKNGINKRYALVSNSTAVRFNNFEHNYITGQTQGNNDFVSEVINGIPTGGHDAVGQDKLYLQPTGGVKMKIGFPTIKNTFKDKNIVINRAELVITNISEDEAHFFMPALLAIQGVKSDGTITYLPDDAYFTTTDYYGGSYNTSKKEYRIRITNYIQDLILRGQYKDYFYLVVSGAGVRGNRLIMGGLNPQDENTRLRLEISYTEY